MLPLEKGLLSLSIVTASSVLGGTTPAKLMARSDATIRRNLPVVYAEALEVFPRSIVPVARLWFW